MILDGAAPVEQLNSEIESQKLHVMSFSEPPLCFPGNLPRREIGGSNRTIDGQEEN
jgi:hypothetical protein